MSEHIYEAVFFPGWLVVARRLTLVAVFLYFSYYPCVIILKPGQHIHIGKGRAHMFRKLTFEKLPEHDCHAKLRAELCKELIDTKKLKQAPLCVSVAFDW